MAFVIVYTLEQYQALSAAIAEGVKVVEYADKKVEYRDLPDMLRIQALMYDQLFNTGGNNNARRYVSFSKGTNPRSRRGGCR